MSKNHNYLEAAQTGDLSALKFYIGMHPEEVDINYQDVKLCSALHRAVHSRRNSHETVKMLIEAGIDCGLRNEQNQTAAEMARHLGRGDLMLLMLEWEFRDVPKREIFYQLLRRNSMEMICIYTVQWKLPFVEAIGLIEEAFEALRLKGVKLEEQTRYEVLQELVKHYGANPTPYREVAIGKDELLAYIDFVLHHTDEDNLNETSDEVLMVMREIVKQMYLGKKRYDEAMMEVQQCLCVFVATCDGLPGMEDFTLIINKQLVLRFLRLVAKQLRTGSGILSSRDRKVRRQLRKTFVLLKEWNSVMKIVYYLSKACEIDLNQPDDRIAKQLFLDRCVQVVGEAIKSTKLTPNLSRRMQTAFEFMTSRGTASCYKSIREFHSHGYPVAKYLFEKENNFNSYMKLQENFKTVLSFFESMRSTLMVVIQKRFLGSLYRMQTIKQVRSLAMYAKENIIGSFGDPAAHQETFYNEKTAMKLIDELMILLKEDSGNFSTLTEIEKQLKSHFEDMSKARFNHLQLGQSFGNFLRVARSCQNTTDLRSVLKFALVTPGPKCFIECYSKKRLQIDRLTRTLMYHLMDSYGASRDQQIINVAFQLLNTLDSESTSGLHKVQLKRTNFASEDYVEEILCESGAYDHFREIPSKVRNSLRKNVEKNIFNVADRFRILALPENEKVNAFRRKQENEFQCAFDRKVATLKRLVENSGKPTGKAYEYQMTGYSIESIAIQQALLEICEILLGAGVIQMNQHELDHRIPIITGKNLRDGLAHDMSMYDVINESRANYVCNAIYYGTLSLKLYDRKDWPKAVPFKKKEFIKITDKLHWFEMQRKLFEQLKDLEKFDFKCNKIDESDILGCTRETKADFTTVYNNALLQALRHNMQSFVDHVDGIKFSRTFQRLINEISHPSIPRKTPNQMSYPEKAQTLLNVTLEIEDFYTYRKITQKYNASFTYQAAYKRNPNVLNHLEDLNLQPSTQMLLDSITSGNISAFRWLMKKLDPDSVRSCSPLKIALANGQLEISKSLVEIVIPDVKDAEIAVLNHFNDILGQILPHVNEFSSLYKSAVARDNFAAIILMEASSCPCPIDKDLLYYVAAYNRTSILEHFLQNPEWREHINDQTGNGRTLIDIFAQNGNFQAVKMLSEYSTNVVSAMKSAARRKHNGIVKFLLNLKPHVLPDMLTDLINSSIQTKNNTLLKYLLNRYTINAKDRLDLSEHFLCAIDCHNFDALELILKYDPLAAQSSKNRYNAYHFLVQALSTCTKADLNVHSERILNLLNTYNADPIYKDKSGMTPLNRAVTFHNLELVRRLCQLGPSAVNEPDAIGRTPLISALIVGNLPIVQYLIQQGAPLEGLSTFRYPILHNVPPVTHFLDRNIECLQYAVRTLNLDLELTDVFGRTLLHELCRADNVTFVAFLLEQCNANVYARDKNGETVLHCAIRCDSRAILGYLLERVDRSDLLEKANGGGETALMLAFAIPGRMTMAYEMVKAGASKERLLQKIAGSCKEALQYMNK
ncbi:AAEL001438-PA [Aedes aegypti]|uniref:AAEL001438-PA n=1 Tax=Aedes aegypti TaxID=7159 RepID=Q17LB0_AEDAE|nr:AAEL001438-PA [Aedes aegypti]